MRIFDFERAASLAGVLGGVYRSMQAQLRKAIAGNDADMLTELREGVAEIADSWNKIV